MTGVAWRFLPRERACLGGGMAAAQGPGSGRGCGSDHAALLERLNAAGAIDWSAAVRDGRHLRDLDRF